MTVVECRCEPASRAPGERLKIGEIGFFFEGKAEGAEAFVERGFGIVVDAGDLAAVKVEDGEGLENVVELAAGEIDADGFVAANVAEVLEIADAGFVEDDAADGEFGGGGFGGRGGAWRGRVCGGRRLRCGLRAWRRGRIVLGSGCCGDCERYDCGDGNCWMKRSHLRLL